VLPPAELEPVGEFSGHGTRAVAAVEGRQHGSPLRPLGAWSSAEPVLSRSGGMAAAAEVPKAEAGREEEVGREEEAGREDDAWTLLLLGLGLAEVAWEELSSREGARQGGFSGNTCTGLFTSSLQSLPCGMPPRPPRGEPKHAAGRCVAPCGLGEVWHDEAEEEACGDAVGEGSKDSGRIVADVGCAGDPACAPSGEVWPRPCPGLDTAPGAERRRCSPLLPSKRLKSTKSASHFECGPDVGDARSGNTPRGLLLPPAGALLLPTAAAPTSPSKLRRPPSRHPVESLAAAAALAPPPAPESSRDDPVWKARSAPRW
jgi:hypothetical protein